MEILQYRAFSVKFGHMIIIERDHKIFLKELEAAMPNKINLSSRLTFILKCLLVSYLLTTGFLLLLALMLYRFGLSEKIVSICIIAIYIIVTFLAGFWAGKREGSRKFLC